MKHTFSENPESANADTPGSNPPPPGQSGARKPRGKPFEPGNQEGKGRPLGSRNKSTFIWMNMSDQFAEAFYKRMIKMGFDGNRTAMKLVFERMVPIAQNNYVDLSLPELRTAEDLTRASVEVILATSTGDLSVEQGKAVSDMLQGHRRLIESEQLERRVAALESTRPAAADLTEVQPSSEDASPAEESPASEDIPRVTSRGVSTG